MCLIRVSAVSTKAMTESAMADASSRDFMKEVPVVEQADMRNTPWNDLVEQWKRKNCRGRLVSIVHKLRKLFVRKQNLATEPEPQKHTSGLADEAAGKAQPDTIYLMDQSLIQPKSDAVGFEVNNHGARHATGTLEMLGLSEPLVRGSKSRRAEIRSTESLPYRPTQSR
jgi:hypothetical protein